MSNVIEDGDRRTLAKLLSVDQRTINFFLYGKRLRERYSSFSIKKRSGGERIISVPPGQLRALQRRLAGLLEQQYQPKGCVHGFLRERSIVSNAVGHVSKKVVLNFDLKDFFPSIHFGRIFAVLQHPPFSYSPQEAMLLAQIATMSNGVLPQGGASSPIISNIICRQLDNRIKDFCQRFHIHYTRYADDITLSSHKLFPESIVTSTQAEVTIAEPLRKVVMEAGFSINDEKTRLRSFRRRQEVTGLVVNKFVNLPRHFVRGIEYRLYLCEQFGVQHATEICGVENSLKNTLRGQLSYLKMVRGKHDFIHRRLCRRFSRVLGEASVVGPLSEVIPSRLTCDVPRFNAWAEVYARAQGAMMFLDISNSGRQYAATAFHVGKGIYATAGHNIQDCGPDGNSQLKCYIGDDEAQYELMCCNTEIDVGMIHVCAYPSARISTQLRLPEIGEEVCAIGYPRIPQRDPTLVMHVGVVESLPNSYSGRRRRFIQVSFQSGGGLSGGCLLDKAGFVVGIMVENVFMKGEGDNPAPDRPYGQAVPIEYFDDEIYQTNENSECSA